MTVIPFWMSQIVKSALYYKLRQSGKQKTLYSTVPARRFGRLRHSYSVGALAGVVQEKLQQ